MGFDFTASGLSVPANTSNATGNGSSSDSMLAYQANLHQAFLQSAMAQNIQIQQQILAQNQALHQLLQQQQMLPPVRRRVSVSHDNIILYDFTHPILLPCLDNRDRPYSRTNRRGYYDIIRSDVRELLRDVYAR